MITLQSLFGSEYFACIGSTLCRNYKPIVYWHRSLQLRPSRDFMEILTNVVYDESVR
jgi:hypothetical protein